MISFTHGVRGVYHMWAAAIYCWVANAIPSRAESLCTRSNAHFDLAEKHMDGLEDGFFS